jgi:aspartate aminotransferase
MFFVSTQSAVEAQMPPPISKFAGSLTGSTVVGMRRLADEIEARGASVIDFGIGEPDFQAPPPVQEAAIRAIREGRGNYIDPRGLDELREAIADFETHEHGLAVTPRQIVVTPGSYGGLTIVTRALLDPDCDALLIEPCWGPYKALVRLTGAQAIGVPMGVEQGRFVIDADHLDSAVTSRTRAIIINTPWNPTGRVMTQAELHAIAEFASRHDLWIVADEVYSELIYGDLSHRSVATLGDDVAARTIIVTSLSKSYAMTGWRLGYCVAPLSVAPLLASINQYALRCPTSIVQYAAVAAFREGAKYVADMRNQYEHRRNAIASGLNSIDGVLCPSPEGTFYAFAQFDEAWGDSRDVANYLLNEASVLLTPGSAYGPASRHHLRLSFATSIETVEEGLSRLQNALPPPPKQTPSE